MVTEKALTDYADRSGLRRALDVLPESPLEFSRLGRGEYNDNWRFEHPVTKRRLVLRLNMGSQMRLERQIAYEFNALKLLEHSGRTLEPLWLDESLSILPYGILVMEWLPGRPLDYASDIPEAARILADIHSVNLCGPGGLLEPQNPLAAMFDECSRMLDVYLNSPLAEEVLKIGS